MPCSTATTTTLFCSVIWLINIKIIIKKSDENKKKMGMQLEMHGHEQIQFRKASSWQTASTDDVVDDDSWNNHSKYCVSFHIHIGSKCGVIVLTATSPGE